MNKIFKVIWNEARNAYVVVSEIAKNHGSKSCSTKKLLAMLIATGVMTCASFDVLAEKPAADKTAAQQYVALKAKEFDKKPLFGTADRKEYDAQKDGKKTIGGYTYRYDATNKYWVREGYVLTVDKNGGKYTPLFENAIRADVAYKDGVAEGILQSVTSTVAHNGVVTHSGDSLQKITAGSYAGVSHGGGTEVAGSWNYIINDSSWENSGAEYQDGYVDLKGDNMPRDFTTTGSGLEWDEAKQTYTYQGKAVDYRNMYVIEGELGVFTNADGSEVYTGTVYGKNNEILMTVKDNGKFYSYWAASVTDPSATMETYPVSKYNSDLAVIDQNIKDLNKDIIKEVTLTKDTNSAIIKLVRNGGNAVDGAITVTSGGGTGGSDADNDTFVKISNGTTEQTFATGSKVEAIGSKDATTGIKINGEDYTIKSGSKVSVAQNDKTTTITVDGEATVITDTDTHNELKSASLSGKTLTITGKDNDSVNVDLSSIDTDTTYTAGNGIAIDKTNKNAISVKLKEGENNLEVTEAGLELKKALTVNSVKAGEFYMSNAGIGYGGKAYITSSGLNANSQKITGVAAGTISEGSTDAVNGSQLNATNKKVDELNAKAGKHTTLVAGDNVTLVEKETDKGLEYTVTAKDTTYSAGDNVAIDKDNKISVDLSKYAKTEDVAVVYNKNKTSLRSTNAIVAENAIALGKGASAVKNSIAIGNGAYTQDGTLTEGQSVALGNGAVTGAKSTSIGSNAIGGREGTITIGANANNGSLYATIIGTDSVINSDETAYKVKIDTFLGPIEKDVNIQGATATLVGTSNKVDNKNNLVYSGVANNVMGAANTIEASNGVTIQGTGNKVTDAYKDMNINTNEGLAILGGDYSVLAKKQSGAIAVVGGANTVSKQTDSTVIGYDNRLIGGEENISHDVFMAGSHNTLNNVSDSIVMGNENAITGVSNVISFGHQNTISANNAVAIGNGAGVSVEGGVALGVGSVASTVAGALGYGAAEGETSIAWKATNGAVSVGSSVEGKEITRQITNVAAGTEDTDAVNVAQLKKVSEAAASASQGWKLKTKKGNASDVKPGATVEFDGDANIQVGNDGNIVSVTLKDELKDIKSIIGAGEGAGSISFADGGKVKVNDVIIEKGGKITGVADGKISADSKEAVNGSQLNAVKETANKGWNLSTNGDKASTKVAPGARVDFSGAKDASGYQNIQVTNDGTNVKVALNKELKGLTSVTTNNAYVTNVDASKNESVTNVEYVKNQIADAALSAGNGISITDKKINVKLKEGEQNLVVNQDGLSLNTTLNGMAAINGAGGTINLAGDAITVNQNTFNKDGRIQNVANGTEKTDAVNYGQLQEVSNVANAGWNVSTNGGTATNVAPGAKVDFSGAKDASGYQNIQVTNDGTNVKVALNKELKGLTSVTTNNAYVTNVDASKNESVTNVEYVKNQIADAALSAGNGISITDKKINVKLKEGEQNLVVNQDGLSLNTTLNGMEAINGVGGGKISFSGGNVTINNNVTFNKDGRIQNVTAGTENTDAVNYGQLKDYVAANDTHIKGGDYAVGEVTDNAGNKSQGVSMDIVNKEGNVTGTVTITDVAKASDVGNVTNINNDLKNPNGTTTVVDAVNNLNQKLDKKVGDLNYVEGGAETKGNYVTNGESTTVSIGKLDQALKDVATTAAKHTTVSGSSNIVVEDPTTNTDGGKNYNVKLADNITVNSVTANTFKADQTVMDKYGLKVGDKVSVSATAVTAGKTSISDEGVKVDGKTYISADGLNANNNKITNVVDGTVEKDSKDAINGGQLHQAKADINNRIDGVETQVISNSNRIGQLSSRVNKVGAGAAALAALHPMDFDPDDKLTFSAGYGNYGGENAAAIGAYYRPDEKVMFSVAGTVGNGENMVNAGVSFALDRTNHVSNSRTALAREVIDLRGQLAVMGAKMAKMEKALGMLDETKTKLFPDIPANHWAYEYIAKLAGNGYIEGYPDGNFGGDRLMTRYEFAAMLYRAIENGAALEEKIIKEFEPELGRIRVDRISGEDGDRDKIERVRVNDTKGERDHYGNKLAK